TVGLDYTNNLAQILAEPLSPDVPQGTIAQRVPRAHVYTIDYAGNVVRSLSDALESTTSFGMQVTAKKYETLTAIGTGLGAPDVTTIGSAQVTSGSNTYSENNSLGYFAQQQLALHNRLFGTVALRADDNSSFGTNFDLIFYPKASVSWVLSEEPAVANVFERLRVDDFKLRAAWGQAGRAPDPYSATQTYTVDKVTLGTATGSALRTSAYGNPDLKPERGEEIELGFDAGVLDGRGGVEFTFYDKRMTDVIVPQAIPGSTGFAGNQLTNLGETLNRGIELALTGTPFERDWLSWNVRVNLATNHNELVTFGDPNKVKDTPTGQAYGVVQEHRPGYPLAGYWAQMPLRNADGTPRLSATGTVLLDTATYVGPSAPTREIGFSNEFTIMRNVRLYTLLDYKGGHYLFNLKERNRCQAANANCWRVNDPRVTAPQTAADSLLAKEVPVWQQVPGAFIEKADFVKLREISVTWTLPRQWIGRTGASSAALTVSGRNLALWTDYSGIDPEVNSYGNRSFVRTDAYAAPMNRRVAVSLNLTY
ncbi:MAG TPA: TonB-dependent receptor, partial [Longimicrobium sp.]|nr:TonB-dependent receptor [Longimicrobium sp.]